MARKRLRGVIGLTLVFSMLLAGVALADTKIGGEDVAVIGAASASPATLVRGGTAAAVGISITANDGNIPDNVNQCDGVKNTAKTKEAYSLGSGLSLGGNDLTVTFPCQNFSSNSETRTLNIQLSAGLSAPLGRSDPTVTFGDMASTAMVKLGDQLTLRTTDGDGETAFVNPKLFIDVNPRPASGFGATHGNTKVDLAWTASPDAADITDYQIEVTGGKSATLTATKDATTLSDTGLTNGTEYCYRIRARYNDGTTNFFSAWAPVSGTVCATPVAPAATTSLSYERPLDESAVGDFQANKIKRNRVVPVKVTVEKDGSPYTGADGPAPQIQVREVACQTDADGDVNQVTETAGSANTGTAFRWDSNEDKWVFNLGTGNLTVGKCYRLDVSVDGSRISTANWVVIEVQR